MNHELSITRDIPFADLGLCLYRCWTDPDLLPKWFCPAPWRVLHADLDPRPGGRFNTTMAGPDGEEVATEGAFLELVDGEKIVFSSAFREGWEPAPAAFAEGGLPFVAIITFEDLGDGTLRYTARARHWSAAAAERHAQLGFGPGWNTALDQLIAVSASNPDSPAPQRSGS